MRIEFDPTNRDEATAVRAVLDAVYPTGKVISRTISVNNGPTVAVGPSGEKFTPSPVDPEALTEVGERIAETQAAAREETPSVDANGEPHDPRIHSSPPKTNADGTWRAKRGVTADVVAAVRAEREQATQPEYPAPSEDAPYYGAEPAPAQEQSAPPAPNAPVEEQEIPTAEDPDDPKHLVADPIVSEAPKAPTPPAPPAPDAPTPTDTPPSFLDVMKAITAAQKDGKIDTAKVKELCAAVGAGESTMGLNGPDNGDKRGAFMALLATETEGK